MTRPDGAAWDGRDGTAGGFAVGDALRALAAERGFDARAFAALAGLEPERCAAAFAGTARLTVGELARCAQALRLRAIEFLQAAQILSLAAYAGGMDPLFFLPTGTVRHDARIYMREINPRHAVPERDMFVRNPVLREIAADTLLDALGKLELELAYLLRTAVQTTGGTL